MLIYSINGEAMHKLGEVKQENPTTELCPVIVVIIIKGEVAIF